MMVSLTRFSQSPSAAHVLIFNHISNKRDAVRVFERLASSLKSYDMQYVIFADYDPHQNFDATKGGTWILSQQTGDFGSVSREQALSSRSTFEAVWQQFQPHSQILSEPNIAAAMETAREIASNSGGMYALVTGSLHLVGGALFHMNHLAPR